MGKNPRYLPDICESAGRIRDAIGRGELFLNVICANRSCGLFRPANVEAIVEAKGYDYDLADKRPPCPDCGQPVIFHYGFGPGSPTRPLVRR